MLAIMSATRDYGINEIFNVCAISEQKLVTTTWKVRLESGQIWNNIYRDCDIVRTISILTLLYVLYIIEIPMVSIGEQYL